MAVPPAPAPSGSSIDGSARRIRVEIGAEPPERLDRALARDVPGEAALSRTRLARLIEAGLVRRAGAPVGARDAVREGDVLEILVPPAEASTLEPEPIALSIVHEDADLVVVDKPAGMAVHPAPGSTRSTLVHALLAHGEGTLSGVGGVLRPGIVHRIDKDTSGLLVAAKSDRAHHGLAEQFAARSVERLYLALCHGVPDAGDPRLMGLPGVRAEGGWIRIEAPLARHPRERQRQAVRQGGRHAVTRLRVGRALAAAALIECRLETGRTHQIRVHLAHVGHPLLGDPVYGGHRRMPQDAPGAQAARALGRQALHAARLGFVHPVTGARLSFAAPLPPDLHALAEALGAT